MYPKLRCAKLSQSYYLISANQSLLHYVILYLMARAFRGQHLAWVSEGESNVPLWTSRCKVKKDRAAAMHFPTMHCRQHISGGEESGAEPRAAGEIFICGPAGCFVIDGCFPGGLRGGGEQLALHLTPCRTVEVTVQVRPDKWPLAQSPTHTRGCARTRSSKTHTLKSGSSVGEAKIH